MYSLSLCFASRPWWPSPNCAGDLLLETQLLLSMGKQCAGRVIRRKRKGGVCGRCVCGCRGIGFNQRHNEGTVRRRGHLRDKGTMRCQRLKVAWSIPVCVCVCVCVCDTETEHREFISVERQDRSLWRTAAIRPSVCELWISSRRSCCLYCYKIIEIIKMLFYLTKLCYIIIFRTFMQILQGAKVSTPFGLSLLSMSISDCLWSFVIVVCLKQWCLQVMLVLWFPSMLCTCKFLSIVTIECWDFAILLICTILFKSLRLVRLKKNVFVRSVLCSLRHLFDQKYAASITTL